MSKAKCPDCGYDMEECDEYGNTYFCRHCDEYWGGNDVEDLP